MRFSPGLAASGAGDEVSVSVKKTRGSSTKINGGIYGRNTSILNQYGHIIRLGFSCLVFFDLLGILEFVKDFFLGSAAAKPTPMNFPVGGPMARAEGLRPAVH